MDLFKFPLARIALCFILGLYVAPFVSICANAIVIDVIIALITLIVTFCNAGKHFYQKIYFGAGVSLLSVLVAILTYNLHIGAFNTKRFVNQVSRNDSIHHIQFVLRERLKSTPTNERYVAIVQLSDEHVSTGRILVNLNRQSLHNVLPIGSVIRANARVLLHERPLNPGQFDYGKYLANKSILAQIYINGSDIKINPTVKKDIWYYSDCLRNRILENLRKSNMRDRERNVFAALLLGQQQDISKEIVQNYQYAGAVHILSVSGLHVGFILMFLNFVLKYIPKSMFPDGMRIIVIIAALWGFAVVAGFSPSVVRSVTMFSFVTVGMYLKRDTNIFHTLLVSMLLILMFEPSFLYDVGFQLSYTALFFILWLQPLLTTLWSPKAKIVKYFWDILTVSFAAQIGTFPLSVYYFHQFPGLFFVTNLVIIPFLSVIMALGVIVTIIALVGAVPFWMVTVLQASIVILNKCIANIASFEQFVLKDIPFNMAMLITLYMALIFVVLWRKRGSFTRIAMAMVAILTFQATVIATIWNEQKKKELIVFNVRKGSLFVERHNRSITAYTSSPRVSNVLQPYITGSFCRLDKQSPITNLLYFNRRRILLVDSSVVYQGITPDFIILTQSPKVNLDRMLAATNPKYVIADGSNYKTYVKRWQQTCEKQKIPFHYTGEKGFFRLD